MSQADRIAALEAQLAAAQLAAATSPIRYDRLRRRNSFLLWQRSPWGIDMDNGEGRPRSISNLSDLSAEELLASGGGEAEAALSSEGELPFSIISEEEELPHHVLSDENATLYMRKTLVRAFRMGAGPSSRRGEGDWIVTSPMKQRDASGEILHDVEIVQHADFVKRFVPMRERDAAEFRQITTLLAKLMDAPFAVRLSVVAAGAGGAGGECGKEQAQTAHAIVALSPYTGKTPPPTPERKARSASLEIPSVTRSNWTTVGAAGEYLVQETDVEGRTSQYVVSQDDFHSEFVVSTALSRPGVTSPKAWPFAKGVDASSGAGATATGAAAAAAAAGAAATPMIPLASAPKLAALLARIDDWSFSAFELRRLSGGRPLYTIASHFVERHALGGALQCGPTALDSFLHKCSANHLENPYHNAMHVSDVVQATHSLSLRVGIWGRLSAIERLSVILAATVHDLGHPGTSGRFHVQTKSSLALLYNDKSVLENFHVATAFAIAAEFKIWDGLSRAKQVLARALIVQMVLATDLANHGALLKEFRERFVSATPASSVAEGDEEEEEEVEDAAAAAAPSESGLTVDLNAEANDELLQVYWFPLSPSATLLPEDEEDEASGARKRRTRARRTSLWSSAGATPSALLNDSVVPFKLGSAASAMKWSKEEIRTVLAMTLKCADVSHAARPWLIHERWSDLVLQEFCAQVRFRCFVQVVY